MDKHRRTQGPNNVLLITTHLPRALHVTDFPQIFNRCPQPNVVLPWLGAGCSLGLQALVELELGLDARVGVGLLEGVLQAGVLFHHGARTAVRLELVSGGGEQHGGDEERGW